MTSNAGDNCAHAQTVDTLQALYFSTHREPTNICSGVYTVKIMAHFVDGDGS